MFAWISKKLNGKKLTEQKKERIEIKTEMASFKTILTDAGNLFKKIFDPAIKVAQAAEPVIDLAFPGVAALYNSTVNLVAGAEMTATAAGSNQAGPAKLAAVVNALEPLAEQYFKQNNITVNQTVLENWVNAVVASLNAIPAPGVAAPTAQVSATAK